MGVLLGAGRGSLCSPIIPRKLDSREVGVFVPTGIGYCMVGGKKPVALVARFTHLGTTDVPTQRVM
jgi:hypothetical protein